MADTPLDRPYCGLADVRRETVNSLPEQDENYRVCINMASRWIDEFCYRDFWFHDYSLSPYVVDQRAILGDLITLPFPVVSLDNLQVDGYTVDEESISVWENNITSTVGDFGTYPFKGKVEIYGTFGYPLSTDPDIPYPPTIPSSVKLAAAKIAAAISGKKRLEQAGLDGTKVELMDMRIPADAKLLLKQFVVRVHTTF